MVGTRGWDAKYNYVITGGGGGVMKGGGGDAVGWVGLLASAGTGDPCSRWRWRHILCSARVIAPV